MFKDLSKEESLKLYYVQAKYGYLAMYIEMVAKEGKVIPKEIMLKIAEILFELNEFCVGIDDKMNIPETSSLVVQQAKCDIEEVVGQIIPE